MSDRLTSAQFHFSTEHPDEFMRAPTLHVGDVRSAISRAKFFGGAKPGAIYALDQESINVDPDLELTDEEANMADKMFLMHHGLQVPRSVEDSISSDMDARSRANAARGFQALRQNRAVQYANDSEGGMSLVVPSPSFNTRVLNRGSGLTTGQALTTSLRSSGTIGRSREHALDQLVSTASGDIKPVPTEPDPSERGPAAERFTDPRPSPTLPIDWANIDVSDRTRRTNRLRYGGTQ